MKGRYRSVYTFGCEGERGKGRQSCLTDLIDCMMNSVQIMRVVTDVLGPDVKLLQSMSLLKPPGRC